jgi:hypothetical protein
MKNAFFTPRLAFVTVAILAAAATRLLHLPPNFSAVGALALFAGACIPNRLASLAIPTIAMLLTDLVLGFHNTLWAVYMAFALITMIGWVISKRQNVISIGIASIVSSLLFFLITNAAMWVVGFWVPAGEAFYPTSITGLSASLIAGIPFLGNTVASQIIFTAVLFGAFHAVRSWKPSLVKA